MFSCGGLHGLYFLLVPVSLCVAMFKAERHFMTYLMLIEMCGVGIFIAVALVCPSEWVHICSYILVVSAGEAALGLGIMVKLSRATGSDRVAIASLLGIRESSGVV